MLNGRRLFLVSLLLIVAITGCSSPVQETQTEVTALPPVTEVNLINPMGPAVIPVAGIASQNVHGDIAIHVQYWKTVDEAIGLLSGGQADFAVLPITNGVNLAASGIDLVLLGVHEWKVFYLIAANDSEFTGWDSLKGKTLYTPEGKGQTADVMTRYALAKEGITPDEDVTFSYAPAQEIAALFKEGKVEFAALPEPYVTLALAANNGKVVLDYQEYWSEISGAKQGIPIAGLFVTREFLNNRPQEAQTVAETLSDSTQWANENVTEAISASAEILPIPAPVMQTALQRIKFEYVTAAEVKQEVIDFLETMQSVYPEGIKEIPDEDFFVQ
ncbi:MAG: ABC transporter substrate-binding protein [Chloroflexi bacterium]|nr:ABC transporter substrate-binding protein [Chloroflexota bacterium]